jgi:carbon monoxide dehydrogenase subunit G
MTEIESKKVSVAASRDKVYEFLCDMNNIQKLLPEGKYSDWKSDEKSCSFKIQGAYTIVLNFVSATPHSEVRYASGEGSPFSFTLTSYLEEEGSGSNGFMKCEADINPFLKMVVQGPLKNLFDYMAEKLPKHVH